MVHICNNLNRFQDQLKVLKSYKIIRLICQPLLLMTITYIISLLLNNYNLYALGGHGVICSDLNNNKKLAFIPVSNDFIERWNNILRSAEEKLVNLLLSELDNATDNLQTKIREEFDNDIEKSLKNLEDKHQDCKNKFTCERKKKWKTLEKNQKIFLSTNVVQRERQKCKITWRRNNY